MKHIDTPAHIARLAEDIRVEAEKYDLSCTIVVIGGGSEQRMDIGGGDAQKVYALDCAGGFLVGLSILILTEAGALDPAAPVSDYIPAAQLPPAAAGVRTLNLLRRDAGLPDPLHGILMPRLHRSAEYIALDGDYAAEKEAEVLRSHRSLEAQTGLLSEYSSLRTAGMAPSPLDEAVLAELVRQLTGLSAAGFVRRHILVPLGISDRACTDSEDTVRLTADDLAVMLRGITEGKLPGERCMTFAEYNARGGHTLPFGRRQEMLCARSCADGCTVEMLIDPGSSTGVLIASHAPLPELRRGDCFVRLDIDAAAALNAHRIYPSATRMERLSRKNLAEAMAVEPDRERAAYVSTTAAAVADALVGQGEGFVIREGRTAVGLLTFVPSQIPDTVLLDTLIIDRRYQRRGFGRVAVRWAMSYQRRQGTARMLVCTDRRNRAARTLYEEFGFVLSEVHDSALVLVRELN